MKAFGYFQSIENQEKPLPLSEVTFITDANELRKIAHFLNEMANEMESDPTFEHYHYQDACENWNDNSTDIIIFKKENE